MGYGLNRSIAKALQMIERFRMKAFYFVEFDEKV